MAKDKLILVSGKRKTAIAKARIKAGDGTVLYNKLPYTQLERFQRLTLTEPIAIATQTLGDFKFSIEITTSGGGKESQIQAARLALARALVKMTNNPTLRKAFLDYDRHLLVADVRRKEVYKPGDSKARAKRQKSYR